MDSLHFKMSGSLRFGPGSLNELADCLAPHGDGPILVVTDAGLARAGVVDTVTARLAEAGADFTVFDGVEPDPRVEIVDACVAAARQADAKLLIGLGGGSPIDIAKVAAVILAHGGSPLDYVGIGQVPGPGLPLIAIPTTAGTGSEVTPIAVLSDHAEQLKKGIVSDHLYPDVALVDPGLAAGLPAKVTAYTGMDALTHCIEAYTNRFAKPFIDVFAREGIRLISQHIRRACFQGADITARSGMAMGSLYGGLCLGAVNTAAVHALAYPLGGTYNIPHGLANTVLLRHVMAFNLPAEEARFAEIASLMGEVTDGLSTREAAECAVAAVTRLAEDLGMDLALRAFDIPESALPEMAAGAMKVTRLMRNNPRPVTEADCLAIYSAAY